MRFNSRIAQQKLPALRTTWPFQFPHKGTVYSATCKRVDLFRILTSKIGKYLKSKFKKKTKKLSSRPGINTNKLARRIKAYTKAARLIA